MPAEQVLSALHQYREKLEARRDHVRARRQAGDTPLPYFVVAIFEYSLTMIDAELGWVTQFIGQLAEQVCERQKPTTENRG